MPTRERDVAVICLHTNISASKKLWHISPIAMRYSCSQCNKKHVTLDNIGHMQSL